MKRRGQEINIFSMSALDLFASAMGVFILITLVLIPFFPNQGDARETEILTLENETLKQENEKLLIENDRLKQSAADTTNAALEGRIKYLQSEIDQTTVLLGIRTTARKFVFVIDMSGSIYMPGGNDYRQFITLSIRNMVNSIGADLDLAMIGYHAPGGFTNLHHWPGNLRYSRIAGSARDQVFNTLRLWMNQVDGGTPTGEALLAAIAMDPEEIILLSDGAPAGPWQGVVREVTRENVNRIPIHAVAVGDYVTQRDFIDFLVELTTLNGGELVGAKPG